MDSSSSSSDDSPIPFLITALSIILLLISAGNIWGRWGIFLIIGVGAIYMNKTKPGEDNGEGAATCEEDEQHQYAVTPYCTGCGTSNGTFEITVLDEVTVVMLHEDCNTVSRIRTEDGI